jgi:hypothetical protein
VASLACCLLGRRPQVDQLPARLWEGETAGSGHLDREATGDGWAVGGSWVVAVALRRFAARGGENQNEQEGIIPVD